MKYLIAYASTNGQTRRIARHMADRIFDAGHSVEVLGLSGDDDVDLSRFDGAILAGSVHAGHYQNSLAAFVTDHQGGLNGCDTLFVSVSLAAAGHDAEEWKDLARIASDFLEAVGWKPGKVVQVAGAYRPEQYDIFTRFIMRRIVASKRPEADLDSEIVYTDWAALDAVVDDFTSAGAAA